ncbi:hypothetical protein ND747_23780, partial [Frankia sp. R82]|nr:hypothetical protein [Frankia sp. R82]
ALARGAPASSTLVAGGSSRAAAAGGPAGRGSGWVGRGSARVRSASGLVLVAATLPLAADWWVRRPAVGLVPYVLLRLADDGAYGIGVWAGCLAERSAAPLLPVRPVVAGKKRSRRSEV